MVFNNIMKIFLPKDRVFYNLFEQVAEKVTLKIEGLRYQNKLKTWSTKTMNLPTRYLPSWAVISLPHLIVRISIIWPPR